MEVPEAHVDAGVIDQSGPADHVGAELEPPARSPGLARPAQPPVGEPGAVLAGHRHEARAQVPGREQVRVARAPAVLGELGGPPGEHDAVRAGRGEQRVQRGVHGDVRIEVHGLVGTVVERPRQQGGREGLRGVRAEVARHEHLELLLLAGGGGAVGQAQHAPRPVVVEKGARQHPRVGERLLRGDRAEGDHRAVIVAGFRRAGARRAGCGRPGPSSPAPPARGRPGRAGR